MDLELVLKSTILEALIEKITNVQNKSTNNAAVEAFTKIITDEPESAKTAVQLITAKIQSPYEWEALQALYLLESCMSTSSAVQAEIGKFRFLNELIKLVSPKYLGNCTSTVVKSRIIHLLKAWAEKYSKETKIKEAFEMLIKQGVVVEETNRWDCCSTTSNTAVSSNARVFEEDEEKSKLLQKLLRSNKPNDLKAANHLIKTMVKEKQEKEDLRLISNNAKLLSEMLSNASCNTSAEDIELMKELKETCVNMKPTVAFLISSCNKTAKDAELFELNDLLNDTLQLYHKTLTSIKKPVSSKTGSYSAPIQTAPTTLLDFSSPVDDVPLLKMSINSSESSTNDLSNPKIKSEVNALEEIFNSAYSHVEASKTVENPHQNKAESDYGSSVSQKLFEDLDILGKSLLESNTRVNELSRDVGEINSGLNTQSLDKLCTSAESMSRDDLLLSDDDELINGGTDQGTPICDTWNVEKIDRKLLETKTSLSPSEQASIEPLSDIYVPLVEIKTDDNEKISAFVDSGGINVCIQLTKNKPRSDVSVFLVLSSSRKKISISNFLFQPVVPKDCRLKLQSPSKCELPPFNPHIPVETIVQIMLIASFQKDFIPLKFVISYTEKNEMITEMGEVETLPMRL